MGASATAARAKIVRHRRRRCMKLPRRSPRYCAMRPSSERRRSGRPMKKSSRRSMKCLMWAKKHPESERAQQLVTPFPGYMRRAFHDAVRAAPTADRVKALTQLAIRLDHECTCNLHLPYVERVAAMSFDVRGPLATIYAKLLDNPNTLNRQEQDRYFEALRRARQWDILLGALVLTDRVNEDPTEYRKPGRSERRSMVYHSWDAHASHVRASPGA